ncbi:zinc finger protein 845-like [Anopheles stephensi]|uniref:zinc finger protein 845 n=1 Tax=Anopheles stephensi TaxID=30069 RepID=UPI0016588104|nr:zinc finger protein 845 [Anopheles stephensi]XP_035917818.1 zinc finger protein 845-like [Anopheles stephensi]
MSETSCRLCLGEVHPDDRGSSILEALFRSAIDRVFSFEIKHDDSLPIYTCNDCSQQVWDFNSYSQLVQKNQNTLEQRRLKNSERSNSTEQTEGIPLQPIDPDSIKQEAVTSDEESEPPATAPDQVPEGCSLLPAIKTEPIDTFAEEETLPNHLLTYPELEPLRDLGLLQQSSIPPNEVFVKSEPIIADVEESVMDVPQALEHNSVDIKESDGSDLEDNSNDDNDGDDDDRDDSANTEPSPNCKNLIEKMRERIRERIAAHKAVFRCDVCDRTYPNEHYLKTHNAVVHAPYLRRRPWYPCDVCNRSFSHQMLLQNHRRTHTVAEQSSPSGGVSGGETEAGTDSTLDQYTFRCSACLKTFPCHKSLQTHVDVMHPDMEREPQTYSCDQCDRTFDERKKLNKHRRVHKYQQCNVCKKLLVKHNIRQHVLAHQGEYRCTVCSKTLSCSKSLKRHLETVHASEAKRLERPYSCPLCPRTFYHIAHLQTHRHYHIMQRCPLCDKTVRKTLLGEHMAVHKGAFRCKPCGKMFTSKMGWKIHSKQKHGKVV